MTFESLFYSPKSITTWSLLLLLSLRQPLPFHGWNAKWKREKEGGKTGSKEWLMLNYIDWSLSEWSIASNFWSKLKCPSSQTSWSGGSDHNKLKTHHTNGLFFRCNQPPWLLCTNLVSVTAPIYAQGRCDHYSLFMRFNRTHWWGRQPHTPTHTHTYTHTDINSDTFTHTLESPQAAPQTANAKVAGGAISKDIVFRLSIWAWSPGMPCPLCPPPP